MKHFFDPVRQLMRAFFNLLKQVTNACDTSKSASIKIFALAVVSVIFGFVVLIVFLSIFGKGLVSLIVLVVVCLWLLVMTFIGMTAYAALRYKWYK